MKPSNLFLKLSLLTLVALLLTSQAVSHATTPLQGAVGATAGSQPSPVSTLGATAAVTPLSFNGTWKGNTSQGKTLSFTVENNMVVSVSFAYTFNGQGCTVQGTIESGFGKAAKLIEGNKIFVTVGDSTPEIYIVNIEFQSNTSASGTLVMGKRTPNCSGADTVTWEATLQGVPQSTATLEATSVVTVQSTVAATLAAAPITLPRGVNKIAIGTAFNNEKDCDITEPMSQPIKFPAGTKQIAVQVRFDPSVVNDWHVEIAPDLTSGTLVAQNCNHYRLLNGTAVRDQVGATLTANKFNSGSYKLIVTVDGVTVEVPFEIG